MSTDTSLAKSGEEEKRAYSLDCPHSFCVCHLSCVFFEFVVELLFRSRTVVDYYAKLEGCFFALVSNCLEFDVDDVLVGAPDFLFSPTKSSVLVYLQAFSP